MAATDAVVTTRCRGRIVLVTAALTTVYFIAVCVDDFLGPGFLGPGFRLLPPKRTVLPRKGDRSGALRFVSMCTANFDQRRLGNQLFNWAAMLYVARLTGHSLTYLFTYLLTVQVSDVQADSLESN